MSLSPLISVSITSQYPAWRPSTENTITAIGANRGLYLKTPVAVGDFSFVNHYKASEYHDKYSAAVYSPHVGSLGAYVVWAGGHQDYCGNEVYVFTLDDLTWRRYGPWGATAGAPSNLNVQSMSYPTEVAAGRYNGTYGEYNSGAPSPGHIYDNMFFLPPALGGGTMGSMCTPFGRYTFDQDGNTTYSHRWDIAAGRANNLSTSWIRNSVNAITWPGDLLSGALDVNASKYYGMPGAWSAGSTYNQMIVGTISGGTITWGAEAMQTHTLLGRYPCCEFWTGPSGTSRYLVQVGGAGTQMYLRLYDLTRLGQTTLAAHKDVTISGTFLPYDGFAGAGLTFCPDLNAANGGCFFLKSTSTIYQKKIWRIDPPADPWNGTWTSQQINMGGVDERKDNSIGGHPVVNNGWFKRIKYIPAIRAMIWAAGGEYSGYDNVFCYVPTGLL